jgi:hypothetical protein
MFRFRAAGFKEGMQVTCRPALSASSACACASCPAAMAATCCCSARLSAITASISWGPCRIPFKIFRRMKP